MRDQTLTHMIEGVNGAPNAGILHWPFQGENRLPAHCLMRWKPEHPHQVVLTALAFQNPHYAPLLLDLEGAATAALSVVSEETAGVDPHTIWWIVHYGLFSTYDRLWTADQETFDAYRLGYADGAYLSPDDEGAEERPIEAAAAPFALEDVEALLRRMNFSLWRPSAERDGSDAYPLKKVGAHVE